MSFEDYRDDVPPSILQNISRLKQHEEEIAGLEKWLENEKQAHRHLERALKPYRKDYVELNSNVLIHRLPNELFHMILEEALLGQHYRIRLLLLVCRHWNQFIMSNPKLWARIDIPSTFDLIDFYTKPSLIPYVEACYRNSMQIPMRVSLKLDGIPEGVDYIRREMLACLDKIVDEKPHFWSEDMENVEDAIDELGLVQYDSKRYTTQLLKMTLPLTGIKGKHLQRWEYLTISLPSEYSCEEDLDRLVWNELKSVTNHLKGFHVKGGTWWDQYDWPEDDIPSFPLATSFSIPEPTCPSFFRLSPSKLQHFSVGVIEDYANLFKISQFAGLQTLTLTFMTYDIWTAGSPPPIICLPHLHRLEMSKCTPSAVKPIKFDLPSLHSLIISSYGGCPTLSRISPSQVTWEDLDSWRSRKSFSVDHLISTLSQFCHSTSILYLYHNSRKKDEVLNGILEYRKRGHFGSLRRVYRDTEYENELEEIDIGLWESSASSSKIKGRVKLR